MSLVASITGTVENADLGEMVIRRDPDTGDLMGRVTYKVNVDGVVMQRSAEWALTAAQKSAISASFLASAKQAIASALEL